MSKIFKFLFTVIGALVGIFIVSVLSDIDFVRGIGSQKIITGVSVVIVFLFALIFFILSPRVFKALEDLLVIWERQIQTKSFTEVILGAVGLILGLIIAFLISQPIYKIPIPYVGSVISILLYGMLGYLGLTIGMSNKDTISEKVRDLASLAAKRNVKPKDVVKEYTGIPKVLDTSVIIDGRILDIAKAGFIEGPLVVPVFVLEELQHIADSADGLKRNRGRRGLDTVAEIQELKNVEVIIYNGKIEEIPEVDSKLLKLATELNGKIVTNDFNLNKVARVQNLDVLNINELANAVKPLYLPGEEMEILIVREGKEHKQGLAYLDDGTMIVVENGKDLIGEKVNVVVTSALQTSAGKMIFAKLK
ncbi:MAG: PIN/TRAM domain-containing protein [Peptoniphilus harei]|uniref:PIN/TRAM domain-containing protein n=1 Tax=Peptoniphilus harei TaxID=54005 RepID=UPI0029145843|nr:PIN/TRAM domain-containing protein [Peptoniphilus harei]MDU5470573.1 PIN/TRAM domain-containing protein [Peptoniphilus harei]